EGAHRFARAARMQRAKGLADRAILEGAAHCDKGVAGMVAERGRERDLLLGRGARGGAIGRTEALVQLPAQRTDECVAIRLAGSQDLPQRGPAERGQAKKAAAKGGAPFAAKRIQIGVREHEGPRHRPLARIGDALEYERVRRVEPDGAQKLHLRGPPVAGSSHDGSASARRSERRSGPPAFAAIRRTMRSPFSAMSLRMPLPGTSRAR